MNSEIRQKLDKITDVMWSGGLASLIAKWREGHAKEVLQEMKRQAKSGS